MSQQKQAAYTMVSAVTADRIILWTWNEILPAWLPIDTIIPIMTGDVAIALAVLIGGLVFKLTGRRLPTPPVAPEPSDG